MNSIRQIQELNKRELENGVTPSASWHADYRDTAYVYIGGLPYTLTEGDIITIFSQFGEPVACHLQRDKDTGKSKGFCWLKYEDQRSTELAVDNLGGATVLGRVLRVDHARYEPKEGNAGAGDEMGMDGAKTGQENGRDGGNENKSKSESEEEREMLPEEIELTKLIRDHDEEDPMKEFLVQEKKEEVRLALERAKRGAAEKRQRKHKHRQRHREDGGRHGRGRGHGDNREGRDRDFQKEKNDDRHRNESPRSRRRPDDGDRHLSRRREDLDDPDRDREDVHHRRRKHSDHY